MADHVPTTPGEAIRSRLEAKGLTQADLAWILGRHQPDVSALVNGKRAVTPDWAISLATALGESPAYWLGLAAAQHLSALPVDPPEVKRRARLYEVAPIKDMQRRGWIPETRDLAELESSLCRFYEVPSLDVDPVLSYSARRPDRAAPKSAEHLAWTFRAKQIAKALPVGMFDPERIPQLLLKLRRLAAYPAEVGKVPRVLAEYGVRFVIVQPLSGGMIDGAAFWLDENSPVVALSLRFDRVDNFWFVLCHEIAHIKNRDAWSVDEALVATKAESESEQRANSEAAGMMVSTEELDSFIRRVGPLYSKVRIAQFAHRIRIHPGIIVGLLHGRGEIEPSHNREMLVPIRQHVLSTSMTDGWGHSVALA